MRLEILLARRCSLRAVVAAVVIMDAQVVPVAAVVDYQAVVGHRLLVAEALNLQEEQQGGQVMWAKLVLNILEEMPLILAKDRVDMAVVEEAQVPAETAAVAVVILEEVPADVQVEEEILVAAVAVARAT